MKVTSLTLKLVQILIIAMYIWSLFLPSFVSDFHNPEAPNILTGFMVLLSGWAGLLILDPRWLANFLFLFCLRTNFRGNGRRISPIVGILLVVGSILFPIHIAYQDRIVEIGSRGLGVYIWSISLALAFITSLLLAKKISS